MIDDLQFDVKSYLALGGAMHDAPLPLGVPLYYDYSRPVSAIRYMAEHAKVQTLTCPIITRRVCRSFRVGRGGGRHGSLELFDDEDQVGKVKVRCWKGPTTSNSPSLTKQGHWILAERWWPYQRPSFVTPPLAGYVSGHSTYCGRRRVARVVDRLGLLARRAAAEPAANQLGRGRAKCQLQLAVGHVHGRLQRKRSESDVGWHSPSN